MVASSDAGEVMERLFIISWSSGPKSARILMVKFSDAGLVMEKFCS